MSLAQLDRVQSPSSQQPMGTMSSAYNYSMPPIANQYIMPNSGLSGQSMQPASMKTLPASQWSQNNSLYSFSDLNLLNKNKVPMNSMLGSSSVMGGFNHSSKLNSNINPTTQSVKPLSSSEINDLLN